MTGEGCTNQFSCNPTPQVADQINLTVPAFSFFRPSRPHHGRIEGSPFRLLQTMDGRLPSDEDHVDPVGFLSVADLPDPPMTSEERRDKLAAAQHLIQAKYDAGVPFFTKDQFRDVVRQLDAITQQREQGNHDETATISITGLDGLVVQFPIDTGKVYVHYKPRNGGVCIMYERCHPK